MNFLFNATKFRCGLEMIVMYSPNAYDLLNFTKYIVLTLTTSQHHSICRYIYKHVVVRIKLKFWTIRPGSTHLWFSWMKMWNNCLYKATFRPYLKVNLTLGWNTKADRRDAVLVRVELLSCIVLLWVRRRIIKRAYSTY